MRFILYTHSMEPTQLEHGRHTLAHLLGHAMLELYPGTKLTLGPAIDNGFYYDVDCPTKITDADLPTIEAKMRALVPSWTAFTRAEVSLEHALATYADNEYKTELINEHKDAGLTFYTCGNFTDLCRGGHSEQPSVELATMGWRLDRVAGAYWRGNEKNKMLTRVYGLAFETPAALDAYVITVKSAKK